MQKRSVRFVAVFAVLAMVITPLAAASFESDYSDADSTTYDDCYYYKQLDTAGKWIYKEVANSTTFKYTYETQFSRVGDLKITDTTDPTEVKKRVENSIQKGVRALNLEQPMATYWLDLSYKIGLKTDSESIANTIKVTIEFKEPDYDTFGSDKTAADNAIKNNIASTYAVSTGSIQSRMEKIHDDLCSNLTYEHTPTSTNKVRSVYTALVDDKRVVCEGYAKALKAICDYNNIECLIITGDAGTTYVGGVLQTEAHMWNYVKLDNGCWYLVDATWDDRTPTVHTYFMAGTETDGPINPISGNPVKVGTSHDPARGTSSTVTGYGFEVPPLSKISSDSPSFIVTFMNGTEEYAKIAVKENEKATKPAEEPKKPGYYFVQWCKDDALTTPWVWDTEVVTSNTTLYAKFTAYPVCILLMDGDTVYKSDMYVERDTPTKLSELPTPTAEKKTFIGWNTAKDGTGMYYTSSDTVSLSSDLVLYTVWEEPSSDPIMNAINKANEFLADDSIIAGVSNTIVAIAICSGILLLFGFLIIFVKK